VIKLHSRNFQMRLIKTSGPRAFLVDADSGNLLYAANSYQLIPITAKPRQLKEIKIAPCFTIENMAHVPVFTHTFVQNFFTEKNVIIFDDVKRNFANAILGVNQFKFIHMQREESCSVNN